MFKKMTSFLLSGTVAITSLLTGCSDNSQQSDVGQNDEGSQKSNVVLNNISTQSSNINTDNFCTVNIDGGADITGDGAWYEGNILTISKGGEYRLSGNIADGYIYVDADDNVKLVFEGISVNNNNGAALYCYNAKNLYIELKEGTENILSDSASYTFTGKNESQTENEPNAALYSKSDLFISGSGSLEVNGKYGLGIRCNDDLTVSGGNITVTAVTHGMRGTDSVTVSGGNISITAGNDGIKSTNDKETDKGCILISGGNITVNSTDNCIKAAGAIAVTGGEFSLSSAEGKGISADGDLQVDGGKIDILQSTEGLESKALFTVNGGETSIEATDDGLNSGGGSDSNFFGSGDISDETHDMIINGGYIYINAAGDGIDSNGDLTVNGGTVIVNGPTSGGDGALDSGDFGNKITVNGGTLIAVGSLQMAEMPDSESSQNCLCASLSMNEGETLAVRDSSGKDILVFTAAKRVQHIIFSSPDIKTGETYSFYTGVTAEGDSKNGLYSDEVKVTVNGEAACGLTVEGSVTSDGSGFGGFGGGGFGGHGGRDGNNGGFNRPNEEIQTPPEGGMGMFPNGEMRTPPEGGIGEFPNGEMGTPPEGETGELPNGEIRTPSERGTDDPYEGEMDTPPEGAELPQSETVYNNGAAV